MKSALLIPLLLALLFFSCRKEAKSLVVNYRVSELTSAAPSYSISYTSDKSGTSTIASSAATNWESGNIELPEGQFISMTVNCSDPTFDLKFRIYVNGILFRESEIQAPVSSGTVSGTISE